MLRGLYPFMLTLALALPGAAGAVGLGDIRVASALNEPLSAQIDIVGASPDELVELRAAVASRETFDRYGAERPAFLSSTQFRVTKDAAGRPILAVHSEQPFTDPLVTLLVQLSWGHGEVIREYSLLLSPAGEADTHRAAEVAAMPATDAVDAQPKLRDASQAAMRSSM
jgi:pilus assembly protein FimV